MPAGLSFLPLGSHSGIILGGLSILSFTSEKMCYKIKERKL